MFGKLENTIFKDYFNKNFLLTIDTTRYELASKPETWQKASF
jgi:hypothetical protein